MEIIDHKSHFHIHIPFNHWFRRNLEEVKALPDKRWIADKKLWWVPGTLRPEVLDIVIKCKAKLVDPEAVSAEVVGEIGDLPMPDYEIVCNGTPRPYQKQGVARCIALKRLINGDEQGLGKTFQSIATLNTAHQMGEDVFPALIICPSTLKENWKREFLEFSGRKAMILTDSVKNTWERYYTTGMAQIFIVNYESLKKYFVASMPTKKGGTSKEILMKETIDLFKSVVVDESHRCKDPGTLQSKLTLRICHKKEWVILLTGTPIKNKPIELYPQLAIMGRLHEFGGRKGFLQRYCDNGRGASNLRELNYQLNERCFFRREKKDVAKDLPEKQRQQIICDITTRKEYDVALHKFKDFLLSSGLSSGQVNAKMKAEALVQMNVLRQISARGKIKEVQEFVDEILEAGEKLILFCNLKEIVAKLKELYPDAVTVTGSDSMDQRQRHIDSFQTNPKTQLIICNIQAAGVGITLTASSRVAFVEFPWTYADTVQCEDRAHRIGQVNAVMCTYFLGQNTIDEKLFQLIMEKRDIHAQVTGASDQMEMAVVDKIMNIFNDL